MDSSNIIGIIAAIVLSVIISLFEKAGKKSESKTTGRNPRPAPKRMPATPPPPPRVHYVYKDTTPVKPNTVTVNAVPETPAPAEEFLHTDEGARVTTAKSAANSGPEQSPALPPLSRDTLRNTLIWGEILQRKF